MEKLEKITKRLTLDDLQTLCTETVGFLEAVREVVPVDVDDELLTYLDTVRKSRVSLQLLLNLIQPQNSERR